MSHGDHVAEIAPGFEVYGTSPNAPFAITADPARHFYAVQFHPEVHHTPNGATLYENFVRLAGFTGDWTMGAYRDEAIAKIRDQVGDAQGDLRAVGRRRQLGRRGADPRGDRRPADLRLRRPRAVAPERGRRGRHHVPRPLQHPADPCRRTGAVPRRARRRQSDPETKRKIIGRLFIDVFQKHANEIEGAEVPRPGHALPRRDRIGQLLRRALGHDQDRTTMSAACPRRWG